MTRHSIEVEETNYVEELRRRLKGMMNAEMYQDTSLFIRFLRARNYDLNAAEMMLRNHINWRKLNTVDTLLTWYTPHEVTNKYFPLHPIGFDKEGSPILYFDFGNMDTRGLLKSITIPEAMNFIIRRLEHDSKVINERKEKQITDNEQWSYIFNFENFSLSTATHKPTLEAVGKMVSLYEANYPEMVKNVYLINTSWYFQVGFSVIKPLITGNTFQKIRIYGTDNWKDELLEDIDADALPAFLGGNRTDPGGDPMCRTFVKHGIPVPEKYFAINTKKVFFNQTGVKKLSISRFSKQQVELAVSFPGSDIEWEFQTKAKDIIFSLLYKENLNCNTEATEVIPKQRCDTSISSESGMYKCNKPGMYYLQFDNTYSWIFQKEVYYKVQVNRPSDKNNSG